MANGQTPDISSLIGTLLSNPEALSGIMSVLKNSGITPNKPEETDFIPKEEPRESTADAKEVSAFPIYDEKEDRSDPIDDTPQDEKRAEKRRYNTKKPSREDRERLLSALRPYLSKSRYDTLDEIIRFASILELFRKKGGGK